MINKKGETLSEIQLDKNLTKAVNCAEYIFIQSEKKLYNLNANDLEVKDFFENGSFNYFLKPFCANDKYLIYQGFEKGAANTYFLDIFESKVKFKSMDLNLIKKIKLTLKEIPLNENSVLFDNYILSANLENIFLYKYIKKEMRTIALSLIKDETQAFLVKIYYNGGNFIIAIYKNYLYFFKIKELCR